LAKTKSGKLLVCDLKLNELHVVWAAAANARAMAQSRGALEYQGKARDSFL
jgi:hypothetical protein